MKKALIFKTLLYLLFLIPVACSRGEHPAGLEDGGDEGDDGTSDPVAILVSRSTGAGDEEWKTVFTPGCLFGIVVDGQEKYSNVQYKYLDDGGKLEAVEGKVYWESQVSEMQVGVYYPYRKDGNYATLQVFANQNGKTDGESNYYLSDALHVSEAVQRGNSLELSKFKHRTSKVVFTFTATDVNAVDIIDQQLVEGGLKGNTINSYKETARKWKACILPGQNELHLKVTKGNRIYDVSLSGNFWAGVQNTYLINSWKIDLSRGEISINDDDTYHIHQSVIGEMPHSIIISGSPVVKIYDLNIKANVSPIKITDGTATIIFGENKCSLICTGSYPGLQLSGENANVIIRGGGLFYAEGGGDGAGIGSAAGDVGGDITIKGGMITATSRGGGAGIGAGMANGMTSKKSKIGNITISGGAHVGAESHKGGAGIGTGYSVWMRSSCGDIDISESTIFATGKDPGFGIGAAAAIGCGASWKDKTSELSLCGKINIKLLKGQSIQEFLGDLVGSSDKVGLADADNGGDRGVCGNISWMNFDGSFAEIQTIWETMIL